MWVFWGGVNVYQCDYSSFSFIKNRSASKQFGIQLPDLPGSENRHRRQHTDINRHRNRKSYNKL